MAGNALVWDKMGEKTYESGVHHGCLWVYDSAAANKYGKPIVWNGITSVTETIDGTDANDLYADDIKYASLRSNGFLSGSIEAYTYPDEFMACDGSDSIVAGVYISQQPHKAFCLAYETSVGTDLDSNAGKKLHLLFGLTASTAERSYESINDSPDAMTFSWDYSGTPIEVAGFKPTSLIVFDSVALGDTKYNAVTNLLFGDDSADMPAVAAILTAAGYTAGSDS